LHKSKKPNTRTHANAAKALNETRPPEQKTNKHMQKRHRQKEKEWRHRKGQVSEKKQKANKQKSLRGNCQTKTINLANTSTQQNESSPSKTSLSIFTPVSCMTMEPMS